jgi:hypothetical protein
LLTTFQNCNLIYIIEERELIIVVLGRSSSGNAIYQIYKSFILLEPVRQVTSKIIIEQKIETLEIYNLVLTAINRYFTE